MLSVYNNSCIVNLFLRNTGDVVMPLSQFSRTELVIGAEAVEKLKQKGYFVYSIEQVEGSTKLQNLPEAHPSLSKGYAVIFGNEVKGVKQNIVDMSDGCLEIPQFGTKHSLNVSVTAGIVVWEFAKLLKL